MEVCDDRSLRAIFPSVSSFTNALRDDLNEAVLGAVWKKLKIREGGTEYEVYYRSVLELVMAQLRRGEGDVRFWSGEDGPAPPTNRRQTPMDGDAFRLCEEEVVCTRGSTSFVLGLHPTVTAASCPGLVVRSCMHCSIEGEGPSPLGFLVIMRVCAHLVSHN